MNSLFFKGTTVLFLVIALAACGNKKKTNAELFEKYYSKNFKECVETAMKSNVEKQDAERKCDCMLHKMYELDSTFVQKSEQEIVAFLQQNMVELYMACDSLQ